jgi:hypothetical protein
VERHEEHSAMRARIPTLLVWSLTLIAAGLLGLVLLFAALTRAAAVPENLAVHATDIPDLFGFLAFVVIGAVVASRRPRNAVGWILLAEGLLWLLISAAAGYTGYALFAKPGRLPAGRVAAWLLNWGWVLPLGLLPFFFLLFPDGRLRSSRWRPVAWLAALAPVPIMLRDALAPGPLQAVPSATNPLGLPETERLLSAVGGVGETLLAPLVLASMVCLVLRFRAARGVERQQFKWLAYATAVLVASVSAGSALSALGVPDKITSYFNVVPLIGLPIAVGMAILRYRLYDIDRLINRTLVYGLLTTVLGLGYVTGSLVFVVLFGIGATPPSWLVAGSTLALAAVFRPARRRIQAAVDRRFNRRRYDAAKTIEAFSARLRDEIDLDTLTVELLAVVHQTMEPTTVSLWLRPPARTSHGNPVEPSTTQPPGRPVASGPVPRAL